MATEGPRFKRGLFTFLEELEENNERDWFQANKGRYEDQVKEPALAFISDFGPRLRKISRHFDAVPKAVGGSLMRIYRDVRFSKDKRPYKTNVGIQFRHKQGKDVHAPGYYLHLEASQCFVGLGIWHPDSPTLKKIRQALVDRPAAWKKIHSDEAFSSTFELEGDSLKRAPKGFDPDHPLIEDLRRKDFIGVTRIPRKTLLAKDSLDRFEEICRAGTPLMRFLCRALEVPY